MVLCACPGGWSGWEQGERGQGSPGNKIAVLACCGRLVLVCNTCITCNACNHNEQAGEELPLQGHFPPACSGSLVKSRISYSSSSQCLTPENQQTVDRDSRDP